MTTTLLLPVPPRRMWDWRPGTDGFCGETSFQMALALHGVYTSAEMVHRACGNEELLIGVNDERASKALGMRYEVYRYSSPKKQQPQQPQSSKEASFFSFARRHLESGAIIAVGVYTQQPHGRGDDDYDHIVPIIGFDAGENDDLYSSSFFFFDLWENTPRKMSAAQLMTRSQMWNPKGASSKAAAATAASTSSSPCGACALPKKRIYAIALYGTESAAASAVPLSVRVPYLEEPDTRGLLVASSAPAVEVELRIRSSTAAASSSSPFSIVAMHGLESARAFATILQRERKEGGETTSKKKDPALSSPLKARMVAPRADMTKEVICTSKVLSLDTVSFFAVEASLMERIGPLLVAGDDAVSKLVCSPADCIDDDEESDDEEDEEEEEEEEEDA